MRRRQVLAAALGGLFAAAGAKTLAQPQAQVRKIVARKFVFQPDVVTLKKGIPAILELTTLDVVMGFNCPAFNVRADIVPGQVARVRFTPDKTGTFDYLCDIFCGEGHERMSGKITVAA